MLGILTERATVYGLIVAMGFACGWKVNGWRLGEGIAQDKAKSVTVIRYIERETQSIADTAGETAHAELEQARTDAATAAATAVGLRAEARNLATRLATCNASTAAERQTREHASRVLADVLEEMESAGRGMAEVATRSRASGLACELVYDGVRSRMNTQP